MAAAADPGAARTRPTRQSWFARHKILTGLLTMVLIGIIASAVNGGGSSKPSSSSPGVADEQSDAPTTAKAGQKVRDGQFEFTVTKVQKGVKSVGDQYVDEKAQGQFVLVSVTVSNIGDQAQLLSDSSQKVRDAKGREFSADTRAAIYVKDNKVFLEEINPGGAAPVRFTPIALKRPEMQGLV